MNMVVQSTGRGLNILNMLSSTSDAIVSKLLQTSNGVKRVFGCQLASRSESSGGTKRYQALRFPLIFKGSKRAIDRLIKDDFGPPAIRECLQMSSRDCQA